ncbi:hypothetical protein M422DRAFT_33009 [Sphaerobolus stellatus SS14]|uniref:Het-C-domain-containing protein n=1 Tax=Sphaerobolus stellatus (strain SS14) TaxID=990650 RepID=A0A0C9U7L8_SPHS4|nr:hypothetical protein M422DRAFT_33009 [Sphaerobolus stellatus SS14]
MSKSRPSTLTIFLILFVLFAFCVPEIHAFGAGNIPSFAYLEGKAFRHGDIEDVLETLLKKGSAAGGGFALSSLISKGSKFGGLDIKRVYFGNWLRDYSQAVDIAGLKKLPLQTIMNLVMVLGFLAHGYATSEFEVTPERLGVYLPTEHIDNPKGYGDGEDPRQYNPKLRPPVDPRELEIDPRTGMKNYIANENGNWDTSKALVRRTVEQCINMGRRYRSQGQKADQYEAFRLLGQALHTLEDFPAHSNFCELALVALGHTQVFTHVGDHVRIQSSSGKSVAPLVTGTFGGSDFMHSLLGEAGDHISQASVSDLNKELEKAREKSARGGGDSSSMLRNLFTNIPGGSGNEMVRDMDSVNRIRAGPSAGGKRPEDMTPQELHSVLWQVLSFRDSVVKKIEMTIEKIPGLSSLIDSLMDSLAVFVYTTLEPFLKPLLQTASNTLGSASAEVVNTHDQYEVFDDPRASDPTHSFLSKDHFNLILNEPAGQLAKIIVTHSVKLIVKAWDDTSVNVHHLTEDILSCMFHPDFHNSNSQIQREMMQHMQKWLQEHGSRQQDMLNRLTKDAVRNHRNTRASGDSNSSYVGGAGHNAGVQAQASIQGYINTIPGVAQASSLLNTFGVGGAGGNHGGRKDVTESSYSSSTNPSGQAASYYSGSSSTYSSQSQVQAPQAPSYGSTGGGSYGSHQPHHGDSYSSQQPSQPPHHSSTGGHHYGSGGGGGAPSFPGASPGFPSENTSGGGFPSPNPGPGSSYAPSYSTPGGGGYSAPPGPPGGGYSAPPGPPGGYSAPPGPPGGYGAPPGPPGGGYGAPPSFPSAAGFPSPENAAFGFPGADVGGFPSAEAYPPPQGGFPSPDQHQHGHQHGHRHGHGQQGGQGQGGYNYGGGAPGGGW